MSADVDRHDDAPEARLICYLSEAGLRDAARQGARPTRRVIHYLSPDDDSWERFFALNPALLFGTSAGEELDPTTGPVVAAEIVVGQPLLYMVVPSEPEPEYELVGSDELIPDMHTWRRPSIQVDYDPHAEADELDQYLSVSELLDFETKARESAGRTNAEKEFNRALTRWRKWVQTRGLEHIRGLMDVMSDLIASRDLGSSQTEDLKEKTSDFRWLLENVDFYQADDRVLERIMEKLPSAYTASCEAARIASKRKEQKVELQKATEWVQEHGSARLRKAVEAKLLHSAMGVYRDERLAHERPTGGWRWRPQDVELKAIVNPSEESLEALLVVRQQEEDADLWYETSTRTPVITSWFLGRMVYAPASSVLKAWHDENGSEGGSWTFDELDATGVGIATVPNRRPKAPFGPQVG